MRVVIGLRNPGPEYERTRHNVGAEVVESLAANLGEKLGRGPSRTRCSTAESTVGGTKVVLAVPLTYMNESGGPVRSLAEYFGVTGENLLIIHDDIDLPFGRLRLQVAGGSGGHNGIRSVESALGTKEFSRLKFGVGRPPGPQDPADFVLRTFTKSERPEVDVMVEDAADVVTGWFEDRARAQELAARRDA